MEKRVFLKYCPTQKICELREKSSNKREFALVLIEAENKYYCTALENLGIPQNICSYVFGLNKDLERNPISESKSTFDLALEGAIL